VQPLRQLSARYTLVPVIVGSHFGDLHCRQHGQQSQAVFFRWLPLLGLRFNDTYKAQSNKSGKHSSHKNIPSFLLSAAAKLD